MEQAAVTEEKSEIFVVPTQHFDIVWRRPYSWYETRRREVILKVLSMVRDYPQFKFTFDQASTLRKFLMHHPSLKAELIKYIREGRIEIMGGMETLTDLNMVNGESIVRNILYGLQWINQTLGIEIKTASLEDTFGMSFQIPQILKKAGYIYLKAGRTPLPNQSQMSGSFIWRGLDGSEILAVSAEGISHGWGVEEGESDEYKERNIKLPEVIEEVLKKEFKAAETLEGEKIFFQLSGEEHIPREEAIKIIEKMSNDNNVKYKFATVTEYFEAIGDSMGQQLPVIAQEFNPDRTGCYTTRIRIKQRNRKIEDLILTAEAISCLANYQGEVYPDEEFKKLWRELFICQFHDGMCGCHDDGTYRFLMGRFDEVEHACDEIINSESKKFFSKIKTNAVKGDVLIVFNMLNWKRHEPIKLESKEDLTVFDREGNIIPCQRLGNEVIFTAEVPSFGYRTYWYEKNGLSKGNVSRIKDKRNFETKRYNVNVTENNIQVYDKKLKLNINPDDKIFGQLVVKEEKGTLWSEEWTGLEVYEKPGRTSLVSVEDGQVFSWVVFKSSLSDKDVPWEDFESLSWQREFIFYKEIERMDVILKVDWKGKNTSTHAVFPFNIDPLSCRTWYDIPFGAIERKPYNPEIFKGNFAGGAWPALYWVDYSDTDFGVTFVNTGTPGHIIKDGIINVSLLRSGTRMERPFFPVNPEPLSFDNGSHTFLFSFMTHAGDYKAAQSHKLGQEVNHPLIPFYESIHDGVLPLTQSYLEIDASNIILSCFKISEGGNGYVIRLYETEGKKTTAKLKTLIPGNIREIDLLEKKIGKECIGGIAEFAPFEIKTLILEH